MIEFVDDNIQAQYDALIAREDELLTELEEVQVNIQMLIEHNELA